MPATSDPAPAPAAADARSGWLADLPASLVVFLVAVPLSLGIALASNAPIMAGLIAAAVGGIVVGLAGGAPFQVSGPAAGLTVLVFGLTEKLGGDWRAVCFVTVLAGILQLVFGVSRVARAALAMSPAVVHGMLAGIGIIIALGQLHVVLGGAPQSSALANLRDLPGQVIGHHAPATFLGLTTIALVLIWELRAPARLRRLPAALVGVGGATLASLALSLNVDRVSLRLDDHVHALQGGKQLADEVAGIAPAGDGGSLLAAIQLPVLPDVSWATILGSALALALIASVESLLCAVATDKLHTGPRARLDRELIGQGLGNTISGLLGGLPITGVIVRSSANIAAGARSRASAIMHGVWVLVFVLLLPFAIEATPKAALAGLLVYVGVRLVNPKHIRELKSHGELPIYLATVAGVVGVDLLSGVMFGFVLAVARLVWRLTHVAVEVEEGQPWRVRIRGALTFLGVPRLSDALGRIPSGSRVEVDLDLSSLDHAGWEALEGWRAEQERAGGQVLMDELATAWHAGRSPRPQQPAEEPLSAVGAGHAG